MLRCKTLRQRLACWQQLSFWKADTLSAARVLRSTLCGCNAVLCSFYEKLSFLHSNVLKLIAPATYRLAQAWTPAVFGDGRHCDHVFSFANLRRTANERGFYYVNRWKQFRPAHAHGAIIKWMNGGRSSFNMGPLSHCVLYSVRSSVPFGLATWERKIAKVVLEFCGDNHPSRSNKRDTISVLKGQSSRLRLRLRGLMEFKDEMRS